MHLLRCWTRQRITLWAALRSAKFRPGIGWQNGILGLLLVSGASYIGFSAAGSALLWHRGWVGHRQFMASYVLQLRIVLTIFDGLRLVGV